MVHEPRPHRILPVDQLPSGSRIPPLRKPLRRGSQMARLLLLGSVPLHGVRPVDLPRKPARHRSVPAFARRQALPHGIPLPGGALHTGRRQRVARLADLCRFRPGLDSHRAAFVRPRSDRRGSRSKSLRSGLDHHRPVPFAVPLGQVPPAQGRREDAHAVGPAGQHPHVYPHYRWQNARRQHPRRVPPRARRLLRHGSGLRRFRTPLRVHPLLVVLRRANQEEHLAPTALLASPSTSPRGCARIRPSY